jgi:hypothetical protein
MKRYLKVLVKTYLILMGLVIFLTILIAPMVWVMSYNGNTKWLYLYTIILPGLVAWLYYKLPGGL